MIKDKSGVVWETFVGTQILTLNAQDVNGRSIVTQAHHKKDAYWEINEMHADHIYAWIKGGATAMENCQMLYRTHNLNKSDH